MENEKPFFFRLDQQQLDMPMHVPANPMLLGYHPCPVSSLVHIVINQSLIVIRFQFGPLTYLPPMAAPA